MDDLHLLRPYWLLSLIPALLVWWSLRRKQDHAAAWRQVVDPHLLAHLLVGEQKQQWLRPINLLLVLWLLAALALAGPSWRKQASPFSDDKGGLFVLLKVSGTMLATDVQPSRLERAKHKLRDLLELRKGTLTGLIVYSGSAHLVMPLTRDDRIISTMIEDLTPELMPEEGDALGQALHRSQALFEKAGMVGSVLIMADAVSPVQAEAISGEAPAMPVQFLSLQASSAPVDTGMQRVARALNADVTKLTVDQSDVQQLARRARSRMTSLAAAGTGEHWQDAGYFLLPFIALCALMWSRRGWVIR